jgi:hypothetical protein
MLNAVHERRIDMSDLVIFVLSVVFSALTVGLLVLCDRLLEARA